MKLFEESRGPGDMGGGHAGALEEGEAGRLGAGGHQDGTVDVYTRSHHVRLNLFQYGGTYHGRASRRKARDDICAGPIGEELLPSGPVNDCCFRGCASHCQPITSGDHCGGYGGLVGGSVLSHGGGISGYVVVDKCAQCSSVLSITNLGAESASSPGYESNSARKVSRDGRAPVGRSCCGVGDVDLTEIVELSQGGSKSAEARYCHWYAYEVRVGAGSNGYHLVSDSR